MKRLFLRAVTVFFVWMALCATTTIAQQPEYAPGPIDVMSPRIASRTERFRNLPDVESLQPTLENLTAENDSMTIDELEQMGLSQNPTVAQAMRQVQALRGKYVQQGLYPNPVLGYVGEEIGDEGRAGQQGVEVTQRIVTAGKLQLNRAVVSHEIAQAQQNLEVQRQRVINDVRSTAYEVLTAQRTIALMEQLVRIGKEGQDVAQELLKAREVSQVDLLQTRIEANSARVLLTNARNEYQGAWRRLASIIGIPDLQPTVLQDDLTLGPPTLTWDESLSRLLSSSPELTFAYAGVERAQCDLARQYAGRVPNVNLLAGVRYNYASEDTVAGVGVAVPLQIFNRNQGNIQQARAALAGARQEVRRVEMALQQRLAAAFKDYANAQQQVQQYETDILPDAKESLGLIQQGYRQGEFGYLELLTAQRTYFRVNLNYVNALRDLWVTSTRIEGQLLTGALQAPGQ